MDVETQDRKLLLAVQRFYLDYDLPTTHILNDVQRQIIAVRHWGDDGLDRWQEVPDYFPRGITNG